MNARQLDVANIAYILPVWTTRTFYLADNIEKAASGIPSDESRSYFTCPEIYQKAANADFNLFLAGHTHGGQICLPGRIPITLSSIYQGTWAPVPGNIAT